jgi:hypothetical protein
MGHISTRMVDVLHDASMKSAFDRGERDICYPLTSYAVNQSLELRLSSKHRCCSAEVVSNTNI